MECAARRPSGRAPALPPSSSAARSRPTRWSPENARATKKTPVAPARWTFPDLRGGLRLANVHRSEKCFAVRAGPAVSAGCFLNSDEDRAELHRRRIRAQGGPEWRPEILR